MGLASLGRLRQITAVVARHGLDHYLEHRRSRRGRGIADGGANGNGDGDGDTGSAPGAGSGGTGSSVAGDLAADASGAPPAARRFRAILEDLGPTYIKLGQVLSTRADLLPPGFAEALRGLQDDCPPLATAEIYGAIESALGAPVGELYASFEDTPVASASIAQVHRAVMHSGEVVAVKVQRPGIRRRILDDLDLLGTLATLVEAMIRESGMVTPRDLVAEFESALLAELDFTREANMLRRFAANLEGTDRAYVVPTVYPQLSGPTVLTMSFVEGTRLSELGPQHNRSRIAANVVHGAFEQIFVDGLFHADPHPGNMFVLDDNRLALIDLGSVGEISYAMRETLVVLVVSIGMRDADSVARLLYRVGLPSKRVSLQQLRDACASLLDTHLRNRASLADVEAAVLVRELFDLAARFGLRVPSEYALVARAGMTLEGILRNLDPDLAVLETARPFIKRLIDEQFSFSDVGENALRNMWRARDVIRELPIMASQILMDLETGKTTIQVENPKLATIARNIDGMAVTIFMGLVTCGLITGGLASLTRYDWELWGMPLVPSVALYLASLILGAALGRYFLTPRLRRVSIGRLLGWRRRR